MRAQPTNPLNDWWRIIVMATVLAGFVFLAFFRTGTNANDLGDGDTFVRTTVAVPHLDPRLLGLAKDATRQERLTIEPKPLAHLLQKSIDVVPSIAQALEMPTDPLPIARLRAAPEEYRGRYLWYKGELKHLSRGKSGHPVEGFKVYEGWLRTENDQDVIFRVSVEPRGLKVGDFVKIEGFFMKLHDSYSLPKTDQAPVLVGPVLFEAYPSWEPVAELDPTIMEEVDDSIAVEVAEAGRGASWTELPEAQFLPLWHLTNYAQTRAKSMNLVDWRKVPAFVRHDQFYAIGNGETPRGTPMRVLGTYVRGRTWEARPNPIGVKEWSRAAIQIADLGGKVVRVWTPGSVENLERGDSLEVRGYYFRRQMYEPLNGAGAAWLPIFVADKIDKYARLPQHEATHWVKWSFLVVVVLVMALFFFVARRDGKQQAEHLKHMDERRRKRRERLAKASIEE